LWGTIISAFGIQNVGVFFNQSVNNPTWYISILILCYIIAYFLYWLSKYKHIPMIYLFVGMITLGASTLTRKWNMPLLNNATGRGYTAFFTGICLYMLYSNFNIHRNKKVLFGSLFLTALFWVLFTVKYASIEKDQQFLCIFVLWPALIMLLSSPSISRLLRHPVLSVIASISFNTYVWHANIIKCFYIFATSLDDMDMLYTRKSMVLFCIVSWLFGTLSYYFLEKPIAKLIDRRQLFNRDGVDAVASTNDARSH